ncbi:hypothetical protein KXD40_002098 [Peronospora effusa]|uniref:Uncharacterized protein n=1 Tax=Peronospora effusa TaxID=542832 RepID=A0A3M6VEI9_9STRA|nr:hypothetical protein DD238_003485 [Peronospora effusa]RQM18205.1 hypothetical protein DD237_000131 [Peronospora effusa]UIZ26824.1 hypothetical protein KXD40_002098 [Peronospora effusa]CAI5725561.1 unnamed protein product [Peronospora effusa]
MATQIADHNNTGMNFISSNEETPVVSKLEATRLALAQEQKKRIDAAVARVTSKKESGKRKGLGERTDAVHRTKKSKTVVDVTNDQVDTKNSIARRMVDRFASMPEPEREEVTEQEEEPVTRSVSVQQFVARSVSVKDADSLETSSCETMEKVTTTTTTTIANVAEENSVESEEEVASVDEEEAEQKNEWDGPTTNFHVKQLGLDDNVDIYAPIAQQEYDVQRVRERTKYMPMGNSSKLLNTSCDSVADSDFSSKDVLSQESENFDAVPLPEDNDSETRVLAEEMEECEQESANETAEVHQTWAKQAFIYTPLFILAIVLLVFALLFAIDWSQNTFQFCEMNAESTEGSEELFSCASFLETQWLVKSTLRKTAEKVQKTVQSYFV